MNHSVTCKGSPYTNGQATLAIARTGNDRIAERCGATSSGGNLHCNLLYGEYAGAYFFGRDEVAKNFIAMLRHAKTRPEA